MTAVVFYFQVHQPFRLQRYTFFDIGEERDYFNDEENERIFSRVAERCYLPMNALLQELIEETDGRFRCAFSISGTALAQMKALVAGGRSTSSRRSRTPAASSSCARRLMHSMTFAGTTPSEFRDARSADAPGDASRTLFGQRPTTFRNTELVSRQRASRRAVEDLGFEVLLGEGADQLLDGRSPHHALSAARDCWSAAEASAALTTRSPTTSRSASATASGTSTRSTRTRSRSWLHKGMPKTMTSSSASSWTTRRSASTSGPETGILDFMRHVPAHVLEDERFGFATPAEIGRRADCVRSTSWTIPEPDLLGRRRARPERLARQPDAAHGGPRGALYGLAPGRSGNWPRRAIQSS